jgi:hypothetical protein
MKKLLLILLAAALLALLSCPSEVDKGEILEEGEYDFIINGGNYSVPITDFTITEGEEYTVTFVIEKADADFFPSRVGGKLIYKEGGDDKVLSGWTWSTPTPVSGPGTYRWTFKAGEKNEDGQEVAVPATAPEGVLQYFTLNAQTSAWEQYPSYYEFRIKGSITVTQKIAPVGELTNSGEISLVTSGSTHDPALGKGNIEGAEFEKVKAASGNGAYLRFYITECNVTQKAGEDGNAVGNVGNRDDLSDGTNPNPALSIPKGTPANPNFSFQVNIEVAVLLEFVGANDSHLFVNMYDAKCSKIELWEYK